MAVTVVIHATGLTVLLRLFNRKAIPSPLRFWPSTWFLIRITWMLIFIHLIEIVIWGVFYWLQGCMPDRESAFYFAGVTYTTVGYGDLLLPLQWRIMGPIEGLTGILMCGLSTSAFFMIVSRLLQRQGTDENSHQ